jgi:hypothetical protein
MYKYSIIQCFYITEVIVLHKWAPGIKGAYKYQMKWKGYNVHEMTWEPATNLSMATKILDNYKKNTDWEKWMLHRSGRAKAVQLMAIGSLYCSVDGNW